MLFRTHLLANILNDIDAVGDWNLLAVPDRGVGASLYRSLGAAGSRDVVADLPGDFFAVLSRFQLAGDNWDLLAVGLAVAGLSVARQCRLALLHVLGVALVLVRRRTLLVLDDGALDFDALLAFVLVRSDAMTLIARDAIFGKGRFANLTRLGVADLGHPWSTTEDGCKMVIESPRANALVKS